MGARLSGAPTGVILAGGGATRLGGVAKGLLDVGGRRMIDRVVAAMQPHVDGFLIASNAAEASQWLPGAGVIADVLPGGGSAAGIHATLLAAGRPVFVAAWDLPFLTVALVSELIGRTRGREDEIDALVASGPRAGTWEPLCAWYGPACVAAIEAGWANGDRSLRGLLGRVRTVIVPADTISGLSPPERLFFNVNTPADLAQARAIATSL